MQGAFTHPGRLLLASIACVLGAAALTYVVDPLQLFRPSRLVAPFYSDDTRVQNAGLIRSQSFDAAFMGTSLAIHFRQSDIDRALGVHSLKLAMTGSNSRQQGFVLEQAIARGARRQPYSARTPGPFQKPRSSQRRCAPSTAANIAPTTPMPRPAAMSILTPAS